MFTAGEYLHLLVGQNSFIRVVIHPVVVLTPGLLRAIHLGELLIALFPTLLLALRRFLFFLIQPGFLGSSLRPEPSSCLFLLSRLLSTFWLQPSTFFERRSMGEQGRAVTVLLFPVMSEAQTERPFPASMQSKDSSRARELLGVTPGAATDAVVETRDSRGGQDVGVRQLTWRPTPHPQVSKSLGCNRTGTCPEKTKEKVLEPSSEREKPSQPNTHTHNETQRPG